MPVLAKPASSRPCARCRSGEVAIVELGVEASAGRTIFGLHRPDPSAPEQLAQPDHVDRLSRQCRCRAEPDRRRSEHQSRVLPRAAVAQRAEIAGGHRARRVPPAVRVRDPRRRCEVARSRLCTTNSLTLSSAGECAHVAERRQHAPADSRAPAEVHVASMVREQGRGAIA
jgi:hypothetical protein